MTRVRLDGPYRCYFKCGAFLRTKYDALEIAGWDWFTGTGARTVHVCPSCRFNRPADIAALMKVRRIVGDDEPIDVPFPTIHYPLPTLGEAL